MRILSILAVITAMATPALAHRDVKDSEEKAKPFNSAQVEKAALFSFGASKAAPKASGNGLRRGDR